VLQNSAEGSPPGAGGSANRHDVAVSLVQLAFKNRIDQIIHGSIGSIAADCLHILKRNTALALAISNEFECFAFGNGALEGHEFQQPEQGILINRQAVRLDQALQPEPQFLGRLFVKGCAGGTRMGFKQLAQARGLRQSLGINQNQIPVRFAGKNRFH